ncbi:UDP-Glycosyltransferase/glycogen phosphorylase [Punctularia strigosozonata HHB-11173 SS5]|uniref:UDP-Glycosyltransferase/glycogen phosphorylase n=1 Tax=Punctularia strigosozonata (strain HHB-11173) TaxID=741275 RepID=UPI0004416AB9|nr:UDP-Glycosyltransferase/glycogen phosphorylase [Punctularia strigosozonata HHB-11173 SS5]EIN11483.1 UDP-Glycosyltransferase/glycogen phosphorylase [Punctularia strigosozonata HHB-11173 SS5]
MAKGHILLHANMAWGHTRPLCNFAANVVKLRSVHVTLLTLPPLVDRIGQELARSFPAGEKEESLLRLIRVVCLPVNREDLPHGVDGPFRETYIKLVNSEPITCSVQGITFEALDPPTAAIIDFTALYALRAIKEKNRPIPVLAWQSHNPAYVVKCNIPVEEGGDGDIKLDVDRIAAKHGKSYSEAFDLFLENLPGRAVHVADLPPMYDYEFWPQLVSPTFNGPIVDGRHASYQFLQECDGVVQTSDPSWNRGGIDAMERWMSSFVPPRKVYSVGPQLPSGPLEFTRSGDLAQSTVSFAVLNFLDGKLQSHGQRSVLYISFGTVWGPWSGPDLLWVILEVLKDRDMPFILGCASPFAAIPADISGWIESSGIGIVSKWSPQQTALGHEAVGWFLTHAGQNSAMESLRAGIPMICWPFIGDQPIVSATLSINLNVAYELTEVRTGKSGTRPLHRTGRAPEGSADAVRREFTTILDAMNGPDGQIKRQNAERISKGLLKTCMEGGSGRRAMINLLDGLSV